MKKSKVAFLLSAERHTLKKRSYLWTFTQPEAIDYVAFRIAWNRLLTMLKRAVPGFQGLRVYEVHPGTSHAPEGFSHGLHVHALCNQRYEITIIRAICKKAGWGRVHVRRANKGMGAYLAKYLTKKRPPALKGWRLWAPFGGLDSTKVSDIEVDSFFSRIWRWLLANSTEFDEANYQIKLEWAHKLQWEWGIRGLDTVEGIRCVVDPSQRGPLAAPSQSQLWSRLRSEGLQTELPRVDSDGNVRGFNA
jgi:hypothetical protein